MSSTPLCTYDEDDLEIARILALSEAELRAEIVAGGDDPDKLAEALRLEIAASIILADADRRSKR